MIKMNDELNRIGKSEIDNHFVGSNPNHPLILLIIKKLNEKVMD